MRLSVHEGDPGFLPYRQLCRDGKKPLIFLNGQAMESVVTADEERGFVTFIKRDMAGQFMLEDDEVATDIAYGTVKIVTEDA